MSGPLSAGLVAALGNLNGRHPVTCAKIEIANPSPITIRVATQECHTPDGNFWEQGYKGDPIRARLDFLGTGPNPADTTVYLANRAYAFTAARVDGSFAAYQWQGATVTIYFWEQSLATNPEQVYEGTVDSYQMDDTWLTLNLLQPRTWNKPTPPTVIDSTRYPNAPDIAQGIPIPIIYGDWVDYPMRSPHTSGYGNKDHQEDAGAGAGVVPMLLVDPGTGAANVKLVAAGHACVKLLDRANGYTQYVVGGSQLSPLLPAGLTETLGASESYITINDDTMQAYFGVQPVDVRTGGGLNSATNPRRAMDVYDETSYATLDQGAGATQLLVEIPSLSPLGPISAVDVLMIVSGDAGNGNNIRVRPRKYSAGTTPAGVTAACTTTTPFLVSGTWDAAYYNQWDMGSGNTVTVDIAVDFTGGTTNKARIYFVGLRVTYRPQRSVITPGKFNGQSISDQISLANNPLGSSAAIIAGLTKLFGLVQPILSVQSQFFANLKGYADTAGGTYTGTGSALIEKAPDIMRHFLATYGLQSSFETGATAFGSFVYAREKLRNGTSADYKMACWIGQQSTVQQELQSMCAQSLCAAVYDRFTSQWLLHVWKQGADQDYDRTFDLNDLPDLIECGVTSDVELTQGVRVRYGFDHFKSRTQFETFVTTSGSSTGYTTPTTRDQLAVVDTTNRALPITFDSSGTHSTRTTTINIATGTYTSPADIAINLHNLMQAYDVDAPDCGYGFAVITGKSDKFDVEVGGVTYTATVAQDKGYTSAGACAALKLALDACGSGLTYTVTYSLTTNLFTVAASGPFKIKGGYAGGGTYLQSACHVYGFNYDTAAGASFTSVWTRLRDRYWFCDPQAGVANAAINFSTATCASLLGYNATNRTGIDSLIGDFERGVREATAASSQSLYGPKADTVITADWIRDEASAVQLRDRRFDFGSVPRVWVKFRTHRAPDLQRMRVIGLDASIDARRPYPKYGTDGSWAGKRFRVLEVNQDQGPSYHTEIYAVEA